MLDISYQNYNKKNDIHGTVLYPATMVAPVQNDILKEYINNNMTMKIIDPFFGSGTALYESACLSKNLKIYGCDINPFAKLITQSKLEGVSKDIDTHIASLISKIKSTMDYELHRFNNINKWFRSDIINSLSKIKKAIELEENNQDRRFFWAMFSNVIRKFSNSRTSTYKLHSKPLDKIDSINDDVIEIFTTMIKENVKYYKNNYSYEELAKVDSISYLDSFSDNTFDILVTSPPYGDNHTTVPYGQFSSLPLFWINQKDLDLEGWELSNYSIIDSKSLGGYKRNKPLTDEELKILEPYLSNISVTKVKKVKSFMRDYFDFLYQAIRVTNGYLILTLANRTVDKVLIDLTRITKQVFDLNNIKFINEYSRLIPRKRTPKVIKVDDSVISSMNKEYVIIYKKS